MRRHGPTAPWPASASARRTTTATTRPWRAWCSGSARSPATTSRWTRIHEPIRSPGRRVQKGEEIGLFQFGGSSIIVAFERGRIRFDEDLEAMSRRQVMVDVEVGMSLGRATVVEERR
ncbi:hypothetical protein VTN02DRAFT_2744 [Thermoascus thermophilus]